MTDPLVIDYVMDYSQRTDHVKHVAQSRPWPCAHTGSGRPARTPSAPTWPLAEGWPSRAAVTGVLGRAGTSPSQPFDDRHVRLAPALAHRHQPVPAPGALQRVEQRGQQPGAGRAERMAERDR